MACIEIGGRSLEMDEAGYLVHFEDWEEDIYCERGPYPVFGVLCMNTGQSKDCVVHKFQKSLLSWRITGISNLGAEIETYFSQHSH